MGEVAVGLLSASMIKNTPKNTMTTANPATHPEKSEDGCVGRWCVWRVCDWVSGGVACAVGATEGGGSFFGAGGGCIVSTSETSEERPAKPLLSFCFLSFSSGTADPSR